MSVGSNEVSSKLVLHITSKIAAAVVEACGAEYSQRAQSIVDALKCDPDYSSSNARFADVGESIAKFIRVFPHVVKSSGATVNIPHFLDTYDGYLKSNTKLFSNIKEHHESLGGVDWQVAMSNESSLATYSVAAEQMGDREWVQRGNDWMKEFSEQFFRDGGAKKHHMRLLRERYLAEHGHEWPNEDSLACNKVLGKCTLDEGQKIRLLDVGSCYNPLARDSADLFDVTALDLYPTHPSVLQCDFLNLQVGPAHSQPLTSAPSSSSAAPSSSSSGDQLDPSHMTRLHQLPAGSYDVVTMSLVLNYLPSPLHREVMIAKARQLLRGPASSSGPTPHQRGLLLIVEKHSIFGKDHVERADLWQAGKGALLRNFKQRVCDLGFELVKYREMQPVNGKRSHLFAFATRDLPTLDSECQVLCDQLAEGHQGEAVRVRDEDGNLLPRLWIKQDFDAALHGQAADGGDAKSSAVGKKRGRESGGEESAK